MEVGNRSSTQLGLVSEKYLGCRNTCLSLSKPCVFMPFSAVIKPLESTHQSVSYQLIETMEMGPA